MLACAAAATAVAGRSRAKALDLFLPLPIDLPLPGEGEGNEGGEGNGYPLDIVLQNISLTGDGVLVLTAGEGSFELLPGVPFPDLSLAVGDVLTLTASLPAGFAITSAACSDGVELVDLGNLQYSLSLTRPVEDLLSCTFNTINAVGASLSAIVPMMLRRNDMVMGLDMGLDRQIDLLATDSNGSDDDEWDEASAAVNGSSSAGFMSEQWSGPRYSLGASSMQSTEPSRIAFATSLQQSRKQTMPPPYALGAHSRPPAPAKGKVDVWAEGYYAEFDDDTPGSSSDGHTGVLYLGADYLLSPTMLIGSLIQFDDTEQEFDLLSQPRQHQWLDGRALRNRSAAAQPVLPGARRVGPVGQRADHRSGKRG